ncbi:efflux RND transporter permease subunit [Thalassotalea sp. LPB0316]|uniref:efflux RND transporter permease subunit n=1 Tax=Thalassotalea sp. LPB0316 TaxID=2769490 RepID=UPI001866619D|nr:efflux RND transporter permease subunit [Thalassotalea sp. LPB0316]QOL24953.1 efflux RND transporter permease subunit [Thalassotalea sp. LPB0316]
MAKASFVRKLLSTMLNSKIPLYLLITSLLLGLAALNVTPREEEPQIVVPMIDVMVQAQGLDARQVERLVTTPLEKLLSQIQGVEHVYSATSNNQAIVTLRFFVGESRQTSLFNTYNKLYSNQDKIPSVVSNWMVSPNEVDDIAIVMLGLWSENPELTDDYQLKRLAQEVSIALKSLENTSEVNVIGGRSRQVEIFLDPEQLAARQISVQEIIDGLRVSNQLQDHGIVRLNNQSIVIESGDVFRSLADIKQTPIKVINGAIVQLQDVAIITDGPQEADHYSTIDFTPSHEQFGDGVSDHPLVTISVAKQPGTNAVTVANQVHELVDQIKDNILPDHVHVETLRDYGQTANEKVNNLTSSLVFAVITVVIFIGVFLGWRAALVVGLAVPVCYGFTLAFDFAFGYTINRVTLFALILSLGLLVDDPITGVDNISRYMKKYPQRSLFDNIIGAIEEIKTPLLLSTLTIILAFIPLAFITGMMGPYMAPMAFNVPVSVILSTLVAFLITPWLAQALLKHNPEPAADADTSANQPSRFEQAYYRFMSRFIDNKANGKRALWLVFGLFIIAAMLPTLRLVPLKLLPFDNKNELQILIEMPESASLEQTRAMARDVMNIVKTVPEIKGVASYVGISSPIDFNGMVRQYYMRNQPYQADLRLLLIDKTERVHYSHDILLRLRELLAPLQAKDTHIKVVEVPPGPPVLSTLVAEVYGDQYTQYHELQSAARTVATRLSREPHVVEVDTNEIAPVEKYRFVVDKAKAALSGVATADVNQTINVATQGMAVGVFQQEDEAAEIPLVLKMAQSERAQLSDIERFLVKGRPGIVAAQSELGFSDSPQAVVSIAEIGEFNQLPQQGTIFHKNLKPVVYVNAEISGRTPPEIIADVSADKALEPKQGEPNLDWQARTFFTSGGGDYWSVPEHINVVFSGEGEWDITISVFRDMGLAFMFALVGIYFVLRIQTQSMALSLIIMSSIPLTIIGIMPGFWLLNQFGVREIAGAPEPVLFTATAMIGMIALAGIVVRNSLILVEFITQARSEGLTIKESVLQAGAVRMRPVLLTAGTTLLGNIVITLDPVFSGLAIAIIFGIIASTLFTLIVVPIVYYLVFVTPEEEQSNLDNTNSPQPLTQA